LLFLRIIEIVRSLGHLSEALGRVYYLSERVISVDKNYLFFKQNFDTLLKQYPHRHIIIKDEAVVGDYESFDAAYLAATGDHGFSLGTFLIQCCDREESTARFAWNNVMFGANAA